VNELGDITVIEKVLLVAAMVIGNLFGICFFVLPIVAAFRQRKKRKRYIKELENRIK